MTPRGPRKLEQPEPFKVVFEGGRFDVVVTEAAAKPGYVMMRRWKKPAVPGARGQWERKALGRMNLRDARGAVLDDAIAEAKHAANRWYMEITGEIATPSKESDEPAAFTIGQTWDLITNAETGKYPHPSQFRTEMKAALEYAEAVWGSDTAWTSIESDQWTRLIRRRIGELVSRKKVGIRATEITVSRMMTAIIWLRLKKKIPANAAHPDPTWHDDLVSFWKGLTKSTRDPESKSLRFTVEESRKLINAAWDVDPRQGLLMSLGAELRIGQVRRSMRSDLDLIAGEYGQFTVHGAKDKRGGVVELTRGQRASVDQALKGYLRVLESEHQDGKRPDYHLFPGGALTGKKAGTPYISGRDALSDRAYSRSAMTHGWGLVEFLAGVSHVEGRGAYGIRRVSVDDALAQNISEHGLKAFGGWTTPDMPRRIYADQKNKTGRADAKVARAGFRGEAK